MDKILLRKLVLLKHLAVLKSVIVWPVRLGHGDDDVILMAFVGRLSENAYSRRSDKVMLERA